MRIDGLNTNSAQGLASRIYMNHHHPWYKISKQLTIFKRPRLLFLQIFETFVRWAGSIFGDSHKVLFPDPIHCHQHGSWLP